MDSRSGLRLLYQLACVYGVQTAYYDVSHRRRGASVESLLAVLRALGAPVANLQDVPSAWREHQQALWERRLEPVVVAWEGELPWLEVRLPSEFSDAALFGHLRLESGEERDWKWSGADLPLPAPVEIEGKQYLVKRLPLSAKLPLGYHRFTLEVKGKSEETLIISAPSQAYAAPEERMWGVFLPLYALHSRHSWGGGDFSDLLTLAEWIAGMGGQVLGTLPMLASFLGRIFEPSPYLPVSCLFWNEFYLDVARVPELPQCPSAQALLSSASFQEEIAALRSLPLVDYRRQMALKRQVLEELSRCFYSEPSQRLKDLSRFIARNPAVEDYARFRAACEKQGKPWRLWSPPLRDGVLREGDYNEEVRRYFLYAQWLAHQQVQSVSEKAKEKGLRLYLDLPVGVHPDGYDVWRERDAFALGASVGAPPDAVFTRGQNWDFSPLHPRKIREQGYRYIIAYLRHNLKHAGILRIDHVMGLHRLFWIPEGMEGSQGVYVRYPAEELYAILNLESHRYRAIIVGEDLGTVPPEVRRAMGRHGWQRMYVLHYELASNRRKSILHKVPASSVASLNTHDMPPFAAFWRGLDIEERLKLGLLNRTGAQKERRARHAIRKALASFLKERGWHISDERSALKACLSFLSTSRARLVLVNLEDLWRETQPQNIPSTGEEHPNWRRKARLGFEDFCQMPEVRDTLKEINKLRRGET